MIFVWRVGIGIGWIFASDDDTEQKVALILQALSAGTMIYVAFFEVIARERTKPANKLLQLAAIFLGYAVMFGLDTLRNFSAILFSFRTCAPGRIGQLVSLVSILTIWFFDVLISVPFLNGDHQKIIMNARIDLDVLFPLFGLSRGSLIPSSRIKAQRRELSSTM